MHPWDKWHRLRMSDVEGCPVIPSREKGTEHFVEIKPTKKCPQLDLTPSRFSQQTCMFPPLDIISSFCPQLARLYPNMNLTLQGTVVSAPFLNFSPGNLSSAAQMEIEASVLLPSSVKEPVFRLGVVRFKGLANIAPFSYMLFPPLRTWLIP